MKLKNIFIHIGREILRLVVIIGISYGLIHIWPEFPSCTPPCAKVKGIMDLEIGCFMEYAYLTLDIQYFLILLTELTLFYLLYKFCKISRLWWITTLCILLVFLGILYPFTPQIEYFDKYCSFF